jgi:hypothetical protein
MLCQQEGQYIYMCPVTTGSNLNEVQPLPATRRYVDNHRTTSFIKSNPSMEVIEKTMETFIHANLSPLPTNVGQCLSVMESGDKMTGK